MLATLLLPTLAVGCGDDPSGPPSPAAVYQMRYFDERLVPEDVALSGGATLHVTGGSLTLRKDGSYELRIAATRESGGTSVTLPAVAETGQYHTTREAGDPVFDYEVTFTRTGSDDGVGYLGKDGQLTAGPFVIEGFAAFPTFQR